MLILILAYEHTLFYHFDYMMILFKHYFIAITTFTHT